MKQRELLIVLNTTHGVHIFLMSCVTEGVCGGMSAYNCRGYLPLFQLRSRPLRKHEVSLSLQGPQLMVFVTKAKIQNIKQK